MIITKFVLYILHQTVKNSKLKFIKYVEIITFSLNYYNIFFQDENLSGVKINKKLAKRESENDLCCQDRNDDDIK